MKSIRNPSPQEVLNQFKLAENVYLLGTFETGLTIYNQQVRALNLAWSMLEATPEKLDHVAIIGGGFAGLTAVAGLLQKKDVGHVSLFEKRAVLCPLQQGSDARWVHPRIYDWPNKGSEVPTGDLPLLNWHAGRASDVAVQVLQEWEHFVETPKISRRLDVYLNVKHLRLDEDLQIEWVGEKATRNPVPVPSGNKEPFTSVVLAIGFGLEREAQCPYWRNETLGQPELELGKRTYLVSGHGDGALVDLFRIRISRFRQDRILAELFSQNRELTEALRAMKFEQDRAPIRPEALYDKFEEIARQHESEFGGLLECLRARLRADTAAVLQMSSNVDSFKKVFSSPASFQNRFLLFALYRAGGFIPTTCQDCDRICSEYGIKNGDVIRRHGTNRMEAVEDVLDSAFLRGSKRRLRYLKSHRRQPDTVCWEGGYWRMSVTGELVTEPAPGEDKGKWRREFLPGATEVFVTGFIAAVAGYLDALGTAGDFRVTLHRALYVGTVVTLQQAAEYDGPTKRLGSAGRAFGFGNGVVGYAAMMRKIVRTRIGSISQDAKQYEKELQEEMEKLRLTTHAQKMSTDVQSLLAVPILTSTRKHVLAVLFADSTNSDVFGDYCIKVIAQMCQRFASKIGNMHIDRLYNFEVPFAGESFRQSHLPAGLPLIEAVDLPDPPYAEKANYFNMEFTDFAVPEKGES